MVHTVSFLQRTDTVLDLQLCLLHPLFLVPHLDQLESPLALIHIYPAVLERTASAESQHLVLSNTNATKAVTVASA